MLWCLTKNCISLYQPIPGPADNRDQRGGCPRPCRQPGVSQAVARPVLVSAAPTAGRRAATSSGRKATGFDQRTDGASGGVGCVASEALSLPSSAPLTGIIIIARREGA